MKIKLEKISLLLKYILIGVSAVCLLLVLLYTTVEINNKMFSKLHFYNAQYKRYAKKPNLAYKSINKLLELSSQSESLDVHKNIKSILISHIAKHKTDQNNGYYNLQLGRLYEKDMLLPTALFYYQQAVLISPSSQYLIEEKQNSTLQAVLQMLKPQFEEIILPTKAIQYGKLLLLKYNSFITPALIHLIIGKNYEKLGQWNKAYEEYATYMRLDYKTNNRASTDEKKQIYFRIARKNQDMSYRSWDTPEEAQMIIRNALYQRSYNLLRLRAPGFFMAHWQEDILDSNAHIPKFRINVVLNRSNLHMQKTFSSISTETVKYWKTTGWERVSTWSFVFKQIYQPDRPDIHGKWEWGGIYLGDGNNIYVSN